MKFNEKLSLPLTCLISVFIVASIEKPYTGYQGFLSHQLPWPTWEEQVFGFQPSVGFSGEKSLYEKNLGNRITELASRYKTGLKKDHLDSLSNRIIHESKKYGYDPLFLAAIIITESSFYNWAQSNKGALGLMQIQPTTGKQLADETDIKWKGKPTLFDPEANIILGTYYLNKLINRFGDLDLALEAYNHGPSKLSYYLEKGLRPKRYSQKVFQHYNGLKSSSI